VKWADNKCVTIVNSYISISAPSETVSRYDRNKKERVNVKCPKVIKEYNSHKGDADLADIRHYSQLNNNQQRTLQFKHFRYEIAKSLLAQSSVGRPSTNLILSKRKRKTMPIEAPSKESRMDNIDHFPIHNIKGRCTYCTKGQTI
ncbi:piggyBac transposable element-derived protein 3-like, partial [Aphis craccivora]